jgi:tetratricopeptide (TPR) repeat protein
MRTVLSLIVILGVLAVAPGAARGDDLPMAPAAHEHLQKGLEAYKAKDYDTAVAEFEAGYAIEPRKEFLFAWAQAERLRGRCEQAIDLYGKFIAAGATPAQEKAARANIDRCKELLAVRPPPAEEKSAPEPATSVPPPPPPRDEGQGGATWWRDPWGAGLVGVGVVGIGMGLGYHFAAGTSQDAADRAATYDDFAHFSEQAADRRTVAAVSMGVGGAFIVGGVVRYVIVSKRKKPASVDVGVAPASGGGAAVWVSGTW